MFFCDVYILNIDFFKSSCENFEMNSMGSDSFSRLRNAFNTMKALIGNCLRMINLCKCLERIPRQHKSQKFDSQKTPCPTDIEMIPVELEQSSEPIEFSGPLDSPLQIHISSPANMENRCETPPTAPWNLQRSYINNSRENFDNF